MPTEFLTDEQEQAYGHYVGPPSTQQLARYFHLDDADQERRDEHGADDAARPTTAWEHAAEIRRIYGYRDFTDPAESFRLVRWLYARAWLSSEQRDQLKELLVVPAGGRRSALDRLRRGPTQPTAVGLVEALRRLSEVRELGVSELDLSGIPGGRLRVLAWYASTTRAQAIQRMLAERGIATLLAFACALQTTAQDDVLDVLDTLLTDLLARVESQERRRRLRTIGDLDVAAVLLRDVGLLVLDLVKPDQASRSEIFNQLLRERIEHAVATVSELARPPKNKQAPEALLSRYSSVRQFVPLLLETITPHAANGGRAVLAAWEFLCRIERMATPPMHEAPLRIVTPAWRRLVVRADRASTDARTPPVCCR